MHAMTSETISQPAAGDTGDTSERRPPFLARRAGWIRLASLAVVALSLIAMARLLPVNLLLDRLGHVVEQLGVWGLAAFVVTYVLATVLFLPGSALTLLAGAVFGLWWGTVAVSIGSTVGAAAAFLIGRYLARGAVERKLGGYPKFRAVDRAVSQGGWKIVALLRLSPAVPFNLQNYLYGLTAIRFWPYLLASWLAMLPGTFMYVYLGYAGRAGLAAAAGAESGRSNLEWVLLGVGLAATIAVTLYITHLARRSIQEQNQRDEVPEEAEIMQNDPESRKASSTRTIALAVIAVLFVAAAVWLYLNQGLIRGFFGPPAVEMTERYEHRAEGPTFDHSDFEAILREHVNDNGGVDYAALIADPEPLRRYNASLAEAPFEEMGRNEKLALLINAYNSFTLELMVDWLPREDIEGIRDIPSDKRWDDRRWNIGGNVWSLNQIEHEQIRPNFREPRIHWAVVCAAVGCPPLRQETYVADRIDEQLADQEETIHTRGSRWFRFDRDAGVLHLTPLYQWYGSDFEQVSGSVLGHVADQVPAVDEATDTADQGLRIEWLEYDWSLNSQENLP